MPSPRDTRFGATLVLARTVDLINVAGPPARVAPTVAAVGEVLRAHGEADPELTADELDALVQVLGELFDVLAVPDDDVAAAGINALLSRYGRTPRLTSHGGETHWHLHLDSSDDAPWHEWIASSGALALALLMSESGGDSWGLCEAGDCGRLFVRTGPARRRSACSDRCATRARVRAHRRRIRLTDPDAG